MPFPSVRASAETAAAASIPAAQRYSVLASLGLGLLPWPAVWFGLYVFHNVWAAFFLYHGVCLTCWALARRPLPPVPKPVWLRRQWFALGAACLCVNIAVYLSAGLFTALLAPKHLTAALGTIHAGGSPAADAALFLYFALVNPVVEELFWRQTVYARLRFARWPVTWCAALSGVLFAAWHWLPVSLLLTHRVAILAVAGIVVIGVLLALFYERTRSIPAAIFLHGLGADVPILMALWVDVLAKG